MKPASTSAQPEYKPSASTIKRAKQYAANALLSKILFNYYRAMARTMNLRHPSDAAFQDYLKNDRDVREKKKAQNSPSKAAPAQAMPGSGHPGPAIRG